VTVEFLVERTADDAAASGAGVVGRIVRARPRAVIGFATGATPRRMYAVLAAQARAGAIDFRRVRGIALDEYLGLEPGDPQSFSAYLRRHVIRPLHLDRELFTTIDGSPAPHHELEARCVRHEETIAAGGGIDLQIVGLGSNGHLGFNEPGTPFDSRTHVAALAESTRRDNAAAFRGRPVPEAALTQGLATIAEARTILLVATGDAKADAVAAAFDGPIDPPCPASLLQRHPDVRVVLDPAAASSLSRRGRGVSTVRENHV
jgi:glucosamine-6-phosphate deaminase